MKKLYFFSLLGIIFGLKANGQYSLTTNNAPVPTEVFTSKNCDSTGVTAGAAGTNVTWDFRNLTFLTSNNVQNFVAPGSTTYGASYPNATVAGDDNTGIDYFQLSGNDFINLGDGSSNYVIAYSDPQLLFTFPFTYNSSITDNTAGSYSIFGGTANRSGVSQTVGDGTGTLLLPFNISYTDVLRVKIIHTFQDQSTLGNVNTTQTAYQWYNASSKFPLLQILTVKSTGLVNINTKNVMVNADAVGINEKSVLKAFNIYPNPSNGNSTIRFSLNKRSDVSIFIYNTVGQIIEEKIMSGMYPGEYGHTFETAGIAKGVYLVKLVTNNETQERKLILE